MANIKFNDKTRGTPALIDGIPYQVGTANTGDIKTVNPANLYLAMLSGKSSKITDANSPYTASYGEVIFATTTSAITINLPASASDKPEIIIRHVLGSAGILTIDGNGSEEIEDAVTSSLTKTLSVGYSVRLDADGTKFHTT